MPGAAAAQQQRLWAAERTPVCLTRRALPGSRENLLYPHARHHQLSHHPQCLALVPEQVRERESNRHQTWPKQEDLREVKVALQRREGPSQGAGASAALNSQGQPMAITLLWVDS